METTLNWQSFKETLQKNPALDLQFQYAENKWVDASYHITEIKQAPITSVDCGGIVNKWTEVIVQLWEPGVKQQARSMKVRKALSIIDIVDKKLDLDPAAVVKIEFGNSQFDTRQMYPGQILYDDENLVVNLIPDLTQCKAIGRGDSCGTGETGNECCAPADKPKVELKTLAVDAGCCTPASGCC